MQSRGQALQSALSSLQQMEKALDRFLVWLADSEATLDVLETEADRYGPRDDVHRSCGFQDRIRVSGAALPTTRPTSFHGAYNKYCPIAAVGRANYQLEDKATGLPPPPQT